MSELEQEPAMDAGEAMQPKQPISQPEPEPENPANLPVDNDRLEQFAETIEKSSASPFYVSPAQLKQLEDAGYINRVGERVSLNSGKLLQTT